MWHYQAKISYGFHAMVFRPLDSSHTRYKVVGINDIPAGEINKPVTYNVAEGDRIKVQRGDVIGWSTEVIPFAYMIDSDARNLIRWVNITQYSLHDIMLFDHDELREYSIGATVQVSMNIKLFLCCIHRVTL